MTRRLMVLVVLGFAIAGCSTSARGAADAANAVAAYIHVSEDIFEQSGASEPLTIARPGEPSEPAGFIRGLRSAFTRESAGGVYGWELIFQSDVTESQRLVLAERAAALDLAVIWLNPDDEWPYCAGEPDCQLVKESGAFP